MTSPTPSADAARTALPVGQRRPLEEEEKLHKATPSEPLKFEHGLQRRENDRGEQKTSAWPLALATVCLIVYASLYPFTDWRDQGISPFRYLTAPLPKYWTGFDVVANLLGYAPVGFLLALSSLRSGRVKWAVTTAVLGSGLLALTMETLQSYLPYRVPSNVDLLLNIAGALAGACFAWLLEVTGVMDHWSRFRASWMAPDARGVLFLVVLWPFALMFPVSVPMGLGQVFERLEMALAQMLADTPFLDWLPVREIELQPLAPGAELFCVALGALIPCLLGFCVVRRAWQRAVFSLGVLGIGICASALSAALSYGPDHAWAWLDVPVRAGLGFAAILAVVMLPVRRRGAAAFTLLALVVQLSLLNQAPASAYFAQTLQTWEQGRFIRFNGVIQWLGWLWPYATLLYVMVRLSGREPPGATQP